MLAAWIAESVLKRRFQQMLFRLTVSLVPRRHAARA